jgi:hypothetical protein
MAEEFIAYRGDPDLHDGVVSAVQHDDDVARVVVETSSGRRLEVAFAGVESLVQDNAVGMKLYSLSEMKAPSPLRCFVCTNWDEEADAQLEVVARDVACTELPTL